MKSKIPLMTLRSASIWIVPSLAMSCLTFTRLASELTPCLDVDFLASFVMKRHAGQQRFQELNRELPRLVGINAINLSILPEESRCMDYARVFIGFHPRTACGLQYSRQTALCAHCVQANLRTRSCS